MMEFLKINLSHLGSVLCCLASDLYGLRGWHAGTPRQTGIAVREDV
jgi:hypothetical protein